MVLTRGGRRGMPACALLRLALPLTLDVSVCVAVVFDQAPLNTVPDPVPCHALGASERVSRECAAACERSCRCAGAHMVLSKQRLTKGRPAASYSMTGLTVHDPGNHHLASIAQNIATICTCAERVSGVWSRLLPPPSPLSPSLRGSRLSVMPFAPLSQVQLTQPLAKAASKASHGGGPLAVVGGPLPAADHGEKTLISTQARTQTALEQAHVLSTPQSAHYYAMTSHPVQTSAIWLHNFGPLPITVF